MANISLKLQHGDTVIELSGVNEEVRQMLQDIKNNGFLLNDNDFSNKREEIKINEKEKNNENTKKIFNVKKSRTKSKGTITAKYEMIDLHLTEDQRKKLKEYYSNFTLSTNVQRICVLSYWYKENTDINEFDTNTIFTLLRMVQEKASFNIPQTFSDIQHRSQYLVSTGEKGKYKLTPVGEDYVSENIAKWTK